MDSTVDALSVSEFCQRNGICRATLYNLWKTGHGPRTMKIGARRLISVEAATDWRRRVETETAATGEADGLPATPRSTLPTA